MAHDTGRAVANEWDLFLLARQLFLERGYRGTPLPPRNRHLSARRARKLLSEATWDPTYAFSEQPPSGRLVRDRDFQSVLFTVCDGDATQVMLDADRFAYLSHACALAFHGLAPAATELHVSTPERSLWSRQAQAEMIATLGYELEDADEDDLPFPLTRPQPHAQIRGIALHRHETGTPLSPRLLGDGPVRVTPIGMTFQDTLAKPSWCGGMPTIVALWRGHAASHRDASIEAITWSEEKIVRGRAGYLLEEVLGIEDPRIDSWVTDAQRGSSRKLDPSAPYAPRFSARWMLSINVEDPTLPASYQLTAPNYAKMRSELAQANGLGKSRKKAPLSSSIAEGDTSAPAAPTRKRLKIKAPS